MKQAILPWRMLTDTELALVGGGIVITPPPEPLVPLRPGIVLTGPGPQPGPVSPEPLVPLA